MVPYEKILAILESRYDYYSARVVLAETLQKAGLQTEKVYNPDQLRSIAENLAAVGQRVESVVSALKELADASAPTPPPHEDAPLALTETSEQEATTESSPAIEVLEDGPEEQSERSDSKKKKKR